MPPALAPARDDGVISLSQLHLEAARSAASRPAAPWTPGALPLTRPVASPLRRGASASLLEAAASEAAARAARLRARTDGVLSVGASSAALPAAPPPLVPPPAAPRAARNAAPQPQPQPQPHVPRADPLDAAAVVAAAVALRVAAQQARGQLDFFAAECEASGAPQPPLEAAVHALAAVLDAADGLALAALAADTGVVRTGPAG